MMTEQEKQVLFKDLCARLPYGVKGRIFAETTNGEFDITGDMIFNDEPFVVVLDKINVGNGEIRVTAIEDDETRDLIDSEQDWGDPYTIETFKPYLRPMSNMTEKEFYELCELGVSLPPFKDYYGQMQYYGSGGEWSIVDVEIEDIIKYVNYLNAHYFDYNGLIEKGLALEAPKGMYEIK